MHYFDINDIPETEFDDLIVSHDNGSLKLSWRDSEHYCIDDTSYIDDFAYGIKNTEPDSVLVCGLGLATIPMWLLDSKSPTQIDVVESNFHLINWTNSSGHLNPTINLINGNALYYDCVQNYDLIVVDIWFPREDNERTEVTRAKQNFIPHLNDGGMLYIPIQQFTHIS